MQAFAPFLALRYLLTRRINLLSVCGVMFAVWATLVVDGVFTGFVFEIRNDVRRATPDLLVTDLPAGASHDELRAVLLADPDVAHTAPRLRHYALLQPLRSTGEQRQRPVAAEVDFDQMQGGFALLLGIDPLQEPDVSALSAWFLRGAESLRVRGVMNVEPATVQDEPDLERRARWLAPDQVEWRARGRAGLPRPESAEEYVSDWPGVVIGWRRYGHTRQLRVGDPVELLTASYRDDGSSAISTRTTRLSFAGYFGTGYRLFDETTALVPIERLRSLLGHDISDPGSIPLVTDVAVRLRPGLPPAAWRACQQRLQIAVQAILPHGSAPCSVLDWEQQNTVFLTAVAHEHKMMQFVLFVVMLVAAFVIYATLHMMVVQKWKDIGVLAAVGGAPASLGAVFLLCGVAVGGIGALLGAGLGLLTTLNLDALTKWLYESARIELFPRTLFDLPKVPCHVDGEWVALVTTVAFVLSLAVSYLPARRAARMNPVQALSYE